MKKAAWIVGGLVLLAIVASNHEAGQKTSPVTSQAKAAEPEPNETEDSVAACTERGIAYFKEMGSYPKLHAYPNKGRLAREVAEERCEQTLTAF
jgi:hypothetical protein